MEKFTFKVFDIGLAVLIHPLVTWGGPVMGASASGFWAYMSDQAGVFIFQAAWWGWILAGATIGVLMLLIYAGRRVSIYWQIKAMDRLSELREETVQRFWPIHKFPDLADCRNQYSVFKTTVAMHLENSFSRSLANQYRTIGILHPVAPGIMPANLSPQDQANYVQLHSMVKRDLEWLENQIIRFNDKYITRLS